MKVGGNMFLPGTIYIPQGEIKADEFKSVLENLTVDVQKIDFDFSSQKALALHRPKVGIYQPWIPNPDVGWTRFVLDRFEFSYETLYGSKIRSGGINHYDVIILPDMDGDKLISGFSHEPVRGFTPSMPRSYLGGITISGGENLREYVTGGGTLIAFGQTCRFAIKELQLPVKEFILESETMNEQSVQIIDIRTNNTNPIAFGMQKKTKAVFTADFHLQPLPWRRKTEVIAYLANAVKSSNGHSSSNWRNRLPVILSIPMGKGKIILMSVRPQFRAQVPATYKLLFNSILNSNSEMCCRAPIPGVQIVVIFAIILSKRIDVI